MIKLTYIGETCVALEHGCDYEITGVEQLFPDMTFFYVIDETGDRALFPVTVFADYDTALKALVEAA